MKNIFILLLLLVCRGVYADTITVNWLNDDDTMFSSSVCTVGEDLKIPATAPTKYGYTFRGWQLAPYILVEYIENTPSNTYFNTGFIPNSDSKIVVDFRNLVFPTGVSGNPCPIVGINQQFVFRQDSSMSSSYPRHVRWFFNGKYSYMPNVADARHTYSLSKDGFYMDGVKKQNTDANADFIATTPFFIFATSDTFISKCTVRLYSVQIYQNDELVHDYVPAMTDDGESVGLYDKATNSFLYNLGTEQATAGPKLY